MLERGDGAIVNVASVNAFYHPDGARDRLRRREGRAVNLAKALSQESARTASASTASRPARSRPTLARRSRRRRDGRRGDRRRRRDRPRAGAIGGIATGRFSTPDEVATLVVLLASPRTANVTGANYVIDGGLVKTM